MVFRIGSLLLDVGIRQCGIRKRECQRECRHPVDPPTISIHTSSYTHRPAHAYRDHLRLGSPLRTTFASSGQCPAGLLQSQLEGYSVCAWARALSRDVATQHARALGRSPSTIPVLTHRNSAASMAERCGTRLWNSAKRTG